MDYAAILGAIERAMGPAPRRIGWLRRSWRMRPPAWLAQDSDMQALFESQDALLSEGRLAWGVIVQANRILFSTEGAGGKLNAPADALYSLDPASLADPEPMFETAHALYSFKERYPYDPELVAFGALLADEMLRKRGIAIPERLSPAYPTLMTSIFVDRKHLPDGILKSAPLPLLVLPEVTDQIMIAPCRFWPGEFREMWG
ncbi:hypothetical protein [Sphingomonas sp.]|uniref:hypothetical protein n=1 Tax=Sphingomonas sp. TaxID=28214 RepID=UPI001B0B1D5D|nr:hypothetical protein [Sphingomonas sp.]MBO9711967.1 hypothetical protein [Sphingomonas sp.]